jgi:hypothetical protein
MANPGFRGNPHCFWNEMWSFIRALVPRTAGFITGGVVVAVIVILQAFGKLAVIPHSALWALVSLAFFAAAFVAHRDQCRITAAKESELEQVKGLHAKDIQQHQDQLADLRSQLKHALDDTEERKNEKSTKEFNAAILAVELSKLQDLKYDILSIYYADFRDDVKKSFDDKWSASFARIIDYLESNLGKPSAVIFKGAKPKPINMNDVDQTNPLHTRKEDKLWMLSILDAHIDQLTEILKRYAL